METATQNQRLDFDFGSIQLYDTYVIADIYDGTVVNLDVSKLVNAKLKEHYKKNKIVYISNRQTDYKVDLGAYDGVDYDCICGIAIVGNRIDKKIQAHVNNLSTMALLHISTI
jgi:hypothetical protein